MSVYCRILAVGYLNNDQAGQIFFFAKVLHNSPRCSMYVIFTYIWTIFWANVAIVNIPYMQRDKTWVYDGFMANSITMDTGVEPTLLTCGDPCRNASPDTNEAVENAIDLVAADLGKGWLLGG